MEKANNSPNRSESEFSAVSDTTRYDRQIAFTPLGRDGQAQLGRGRVLIVGCGALGGTVAGLLVRAGVGTDGKDGRGAVAIIDPDRVQVDNLHRQTLFTERDAETGRFKVEAAKQTLHAANRQARLETIVGRFDESNASMAESFDLLIDASDDFPTRFVLNRAAVHYRKPFLSAGIRGAAGQILAVFPGETACLECLLGPLRSAAPHAAPSVSPAANETRRHGVFPPAPALLATLQASAALKILAGHSNAVNRSLLLVDLWNHSFRMMDVPRDEWCPVCGPDRSFDF